MGKPVPTGETQGTKQQGQIFDVDSFDLGATSPTTIGSATAGAGVGKATFQKLVVTKLVDKSSSGLFLDLAKGTHLTSAEISVRKAGPKGTSVPLAQYVMTTVAITDIHAAGGARTPHRDDSGCIRVDPVRHL